MAVPEGKADVTEAWLQEVMTKALDQGSFKVTVKSLEVIKEWKGFIGVNFKAIVSLTSSSGLSTDLDLFIKIGPEKGTLIHPWVKMYQLEEREIRAYNE